MTEYAIFAYVVVTLVVTGSAYSHNSKTRSRAKAIIIALALAIGWPVLAVLLLLAGFVNAITSPD